MAKKVFKRQKVEKKGVLTNDDLFFDKQVVISKTSYLAYLIYVFNDLYDLYGIKENEISLILYLNELVYFSIKIDINGNTVNLKQLFEKDYIKPIYIKNEKKYELTDKSKRLIHDFYYLLKNKDKYLNNNLLCKSELNLRLKKLLTNF